MFNYVYRVQCLADGSAYFGIKRSGDINWGEEGNFWKLGIQPVTRKWQQKVQQVGMKPWRITIILCTTEEEYAKRELEKVLEATKGHPLSLNYDEAAHHDILRENQVKATAAAAEAHRDVPLTKDHKKAISEGQKKKHKERKEAKAKEAPKFEAAGDGMRWIHNPTTGEEMSIFTDEDLITGFAEGRKPKS